MCDMCDYMRDAKIVAASVAILNQVDYENFHRMNYIVAEMFNNVPEEDFEGTIMVDLNLDKDFDISKIGVNEILMLGKAVLAFQMATDMFTGELAEGLEALKILKAVERLPEAFEHFVDNMDLSNLGGDDNDEV